MLINGHELSHFYEVEDTREVIHERWKIAVVFQRFFFRNFEDAPDAEKLMLHIFQHFIDEAKKFGEDKRFTCVINHPDANHPVSIPFRGFEQNNADAILVEFLKLQESANDVNLFDGSLSMEMVCISTAIVQLLYYCLRSLAR